VNFKEGDFLVWHKPLRGINLYRYMGEIEGLCVVMNVTDQIQMKVQKYLLRAATEEDMYCR